MIVNYEKLVSNPTHEDNKRARELVLNCYNYLLENIDPVKLVMERVHLDGKYLVIKSRKSILKMDLSKFDEIILIGSGKASMGMAKGFETVLRDLITDAAIISPINMSKSYELEKVKVFYGTHPLPSEMNIESTQKVIDIVKGLDEKALVIYLISGGTSSLLEMPCPGISLEDLRETTKLCLEAGMNIVEVNSVRKHLSSVKGGRLAEIVYPAKLVTVAFSDVPENRPDTIGSGPTVPDETTYESAIYALKKHKIWDKIKENVKNILLKGSRGELRETPKSDNPIFKNSEFLVLADNMDACLFAKNYLSENGVKSYILATNMEGEAKYVGTFIARIARDAKISGTFNGKPLGIIIGGETFVNVVGGGFGGRNQEVVLSGVEILNNLNGVAFASIGTDGIDGNSDAAGAIIDGETLSRSQKLNLDFREYLERNDSYTFFKKLEDNIFTGLTGTNLNDVSICVIL